MFEDFAFCGYPKSLTPNSLVKKIINFFDFKESFDQIIWLMDPGLIGTSAIFGVL